MKKNKLLVAVVFIFVGFGLFYLGRPYFFGGDLVEEIIHLDQNSVEHIIIDSPKAIKSGESLVNKRIYIRDPKTLINISDALQQAKRWKPVHPISVWRCVVTIHTQSKTLKFLVKRTKKNGVLIQVKSKGEWGWNLGTLRVDNLGEILERVVQS